MEKQKLTGLRLGLAVIKALIESPGGIQFNRLASLLDTVPAPTLSRTLKTLAEDKWVVKNDRSYSIGPEFIRNAQKVAGTLSLAEIVQPVVDDLAMLTNESAAFAEFFGPHFKFTATHNMAESFHYMECGLPNPKLTYNPFCITLLAHLPGSTVNHSIDIAPPKMGVPEFRRLLRKIQKENIHFTDFPYNNRFVAPVFEGEGGILVGSIGISRTSPRGSNDKILRLKQAVNDAAQAATTKIGKQKRR